MKRNQTVSFCLAISVIATTTLLSAQRQPALAQTSASVSVNHLNPEQVSESNIQLMREDTHAERKKIVAANMPFTETEATTFWAIYHRYIVETIKVNDVRYALIKEYAQNYHSATPDQADGFIKRWLALEALDQDNTKLRLKFKPDFQQVISHHKTALFFQIDRQLGMLIDVQFASHIPLLKP